jgi:hypothetical protein
MAAKGSTIDAVLKLGSRIDGRAVGSRPSPVRHKRQRLQCLRIQQPARHGEGRMRIPGNRTGICGGTMTAAQRAKHRRRLACREFILASRDDITDIARPRPAGRAKQNESKHRRVWGRQVLPQDTAPAQQSFTPSWGRKKPVCSIGKSPERNSIYGSGLPISELVVYAKLEVLNLVEVFLENRDRIVDTQRAERRLPDQTNTDRRAQRVASSPFTNSAP